MLFCRTAALVAMSLFAAGTSGVSATGKIVHPSSAKKVKSFKFCSRPVIDSVSFQPIVAFDEGQYLDLNLGGMNNLDGGIPIFFYPYAGPPSLEEDGSRYPNWGVLGNVMQADFGFKSPIVGCDSAADGDFDSTSLGMMVGTCKSISTTMNATEIFELFFKERLASQTPIGDEIHFGDKSNFGDFPIGDDPRDIPQPLQFPVEYFETELYCTWKAIFNAPKTKAGQKTVLSGSSLRTALKAEEDFVDGRTGLLSGNKPLFVSSVVQAEELPPQGRMLEENPFETAYTEYTVSYGKFSGWNPFYLSSKK